FNTDLRSGRTKTHNKNVSDSNSNDYSSSAESMNRETNTSTNSLVDSSTTTESTIANNSAKDQTGVDTQTSTTDYTSTTTTNPKNATSTDAIQSSAGSTIYGLNSGRDLSSKENNSVGLSDRWNMGSAAATAATLITNGTAISETVSAGASLITSFSFPDFIKALQGQGQTSILSNPKISVMNGQPALISVGKNVTYIDKITSTIDDNGNVSYSVSTDKVLSGVGLALSAVVKRNNEIVMNLVPITSELSEPVGYKEFGGTAGATVGLPVVNRREMNTTVTVKDGSMLVVGGLISDKEIKNGENFIPGTKDIPYLNRLFGYEEKQTIKRELIILLRPRIIN
ncbi:hypothetical protein VU05_00955, partial [Desulfobulbus sp. F1]|nr:hypothetical protein [Desulfobulbus sp. F1]